MPNTLEIKTVSGGGILYQTSDNKYLEEGEIQVKSNKKPSKEEMDQMRFAWCVAKHVKSNAIVVGNDMHTLGIGAGQMNRVQSARIALEQAGEKAKGAILVSDAFIPMRDTVDLAAKFGIKTIVQTGGSIRDEEVIQAANEHGITMLFTGLRHFKH